MYTTICILSERNKEGYRDIWMYFIEDGEAREEGDIARIRN